MDDHAEPEEPDTPDDSAAPEAAAAADGAADVEDAGDHGDDDDAGDVTEDDDAEPDETEAEAEAEAAEGEEPEVPEGSGDPEKQEKQEEQEEPEANDELPELELELKPYDDSVPYSAEYTASLGVEEQAEASPEAPELPHEEEQAEASDEPEQAAAPESEPEGADGSAVEEHVEPDGSEASGDSVEPEEAAADAADAVDSVDARKQAAQANGLIDEDGRVPVEELESGDRVRGRPCDDTGYEIQAEDLEFLGLNEDQVEAWQNFEAPLGMTAEQFTEFKSSLNEALAADGIDPEQVDIRLQGSSAQFFSGSHKDFPTEEDLADQPEALAKLTEWMGDRTESERPARIPFDAKHLLGAGNGDGGIEDPSDYDVQLSADSMVDKAKEVWEAADPEKRRPDVIHPKYNFVDKATMRESFPAMNDWAKNWEAETGREVAPALFGTGGPPDQSAVGSGISTHFRETDWIINRPEGDE